MVKTVRKYVLLLLIFLFTILLFLGGYFSSTASFTRGERLAEASAASSNRYYLIIIRCERVEYEHLGEDITFRHSYGNLEIHSGDTLTLIGTQVRIETLITEDDEQTPDTGSGFVVFDVQQDTGTVSQTLRIRVNEEGSTRYPHAYAIWEITYTLTPYVP